MLKTAKPFIKWAGGKGSLLETFSYFYPIELLQGHINRYGECFVGGGANFLHILQNTTIEEAVINDINQDLINTYIIIKTSVDELMDGLNDLHYKFNNSTNENKKKMYSEIRNRFNSNKISKDIFFFKDKKYIQKAIDFIFLNKTCFNGLYRVNKNGEFNVPIGDYKNVNLFDKDNLQCICELLRRVRILCGDYKDTLMFANKNTFFYFDPPYKPIGKTSSFNTYTKYGFNDNEQIRLAKFIHKVQDENAFVMVSNSHSASIDDNTFLYKLYSEFNIYKIKANRLINSKANKRGKINELIITNYDINKNDIYKMLDIIIIK